MNSLNTINENFFKNYKIIFGCNYIDAKQFVQNNPIAKKTFRYFETRDESCLKNHIFNLMIYNDTTPIGYGHLDRDGAYIWLGVVIADSMHGKNLGQFILNHLICKAIELNITKIKLSVDSNNTKAIKLYLKNNFKPVNFINDNIIIYELNLENYYG
jgi:ribosomal protein S18 acetylase RimI-like enzyme